MDDLARELRLYRRLLAFLGAIYLVWWGAVEALLPHALNPLFGRLLVVMVVWGVALASYTSERVRARIRPLWAGCLWLVTAHYFYLFYANDGDINWMVGSFITVSATCLALLSPASLTSYSVFAAALSLVLLIALPSLRHSVFFPGVLTVLLQANVGMYSRLRVVRELAASNEHFLLLFNSTFEGVLIHDAGRILQVNDALVRAVGFSATELIGRDVRELLHPDDLARALDTLMSGTAACEARMLRPGGAALEVEIRGKPLPDRSRVTRLLTIADMTERNRTAAAIRTSNAALERSNLDLQRFASVASHDLQTPMRSIGSFVDLLHSTYGDQLDEQGKDWLRRTSKSVTHLRTLIDDLLAYARVDAEPRAFEPVPMRDVVERVISLLDVAVRESTAKITYGELPEVLGDRIAARAPRAEPRQQRAPVSRPRGTRASTSRRRTWATNGGSRCATTGSESLRDTTSRSSRSSSAFTTRRSIRAPASVSRSAGASSIATEGRSG